MSVVYDASRATFHDYWGLVFVLFPLAYTVHATIKGASLRKRLVGAGLTLLVFLLFFMLPLADFHHVRAALTDGSARTTEGLISQHKRETIRRFTGTSRGVGVTSSSHYTSTTTEQFYVGTQWFWLRVNGYPSSLSFTNGGNPPIALKDGMRARVTWFNDGWNGDETRILRFELLEDGAGADAALPADFAAFWRRFSAAAAGGDEAGVKALTRFPFLFAGTPLDAGRFDSIWMGIFPPPHRACFAQATPLKDGDAWSVSCGAYVYVFEAGADGWKLASFTPDPEAEM